MIKYLIFLFTFFILMSTIQCTTGKPKTSVLVVTGGHSYDTAEFLAMFEAMEGLEYETALKPDAWTMLGKEKVFDVIVFYDMWQEISEKEKKVFLSEFDRGTGMVFLHHSLVSHHEWPVYTQLTGGKYFQPKHTSDTSKLSGYRHDNQAYENKSFSRLVNNAILWTGENWDSEDDQTHN